MLVCCPCVADQHTHRRPDMPGGWPSEQSGKPDLSTRKWSLATYLPTDYMRTIKRVSIASTLPTQTVSSLSTHRNSGEKLSVHER